MFVGHVCLVGRAETDWSGSGLSGLLVVTISPPLSGSCPAPPGRRLANYSQRYSLLSIVNLCLPTVIFQTDMAEGGSMRTDMAGGGSMRTDMAGVGA